MMGPAGFSLVAALLGITVAACTAPSEPRGLLAPEDWPADNLAVGYIGHASVLIRMSGTFVLTDPAFNDRIGIAVGPLTLGPKRLVKPALPIDRLPPPSVVLISHAHFDSLDLPSLRQLPRSPTLVVPRACGDLVSDLGFARSVELHWGERLQIDGLTIEAVPVKHWGKRVPWGQQRGYNGYLLSKAGIHVLYVPDTAYTPSFDRFQRDGPPLTAAILGNGAYDPWIRNHADPEQVWRMFEESGADYLIPIHWDTFRLGKEPIGDAMRRLRTAAGLGASKIVISEIGGQWMWRHHTE